MRSIVFLVIFHVAMLFAVPSWAATYYIDITAGDDTRTSTQAQSKSTPWKHLRCMVSVTPGSAAATYTPMAGDVFVLKGGETWGTTNFPCKWQWNGTSAVNQITVTTDSTWFTGASWTRPIWNGQDTPQPFTYFSGLTANVMLYCDFLNTSCDYSTFSNIEVTGFAWSTATTWCAVIFGAGATNWTIDQFYIHRWSHAGATADCNILLGESGGNQARGNTFQNGIIDGSDQIGSASGGNYLWPIYINSYFSDISGGFLTKGNAVVRGNTFLRCTHSAIELLSHPNFLESLGFTPTTAHTIYVSHNYFSLGGAGGTGSGCETAFIGNPGETAYLWNNVWVDMPGAFPELTQNGGVGAACHPACAGVAAYFWNNTFYSALPTASYCIRNGHAGEGLYTRIEFLNNHCIAGAGILDPALETVTLVGTPNYWHTTVVSANADGYTSSQTYKYAPTSALSPTVTTAGTNLSSLCTGNFVSLCTDTTYGVTVNTANHTVTPARTAVARPSVGAWNIGAYQLSGDTLAPAAPTNLRIQ